MHLRYTAREGGDTLKVKVIDELEDAINGAALGSGSTGRAISVSAANDEADAWYQFLNPSDTTADPALVIDLGAARFPYPFQQTTIMITDVQVILLLADPTAYDSGSKLKLSLSIGGSSPTSATLEASDSQWGGQPAATFSVSVAPATLTLTAPQANLASLVAATTVTNLVLIARYTVTLG
jgi:hypothetical protein